ncbi:hypothetical protein HGB07_08500 [Candidatus Roizmanbacteria bacterium]|nr:hypothetical protein [Candidatus Roizmanbacteria bacterium]
MSSNLMYSYCFEARGIQQYILETGKLKDMVGASRLVDELCQFSGSDDLLQKVIDALSLDVAKVRFLRRAGGAFIALLSNKEDAIALQNLWTLLISHYSPGLEWVDALEEGNTEQEVVELGIRKLLSRRNNPPVSLPEAGPFVQFSSRTGRAGVEKKGDEWLDNSTSRKRKMNNGSDDVGRHFLPQVFCKSHVWAHSFDEKDDGNNRLMPFLEGAERTLGVIHADGNGLGVALQSLQEATKNLPRYQELFWNFSCAIATATRNAVLVATEKVLIPNAQNKGHYSILPARPLVLGGDDMTIIVRGDLALEYLNVFLQAFETASHEQLGPLHSEIDKLPEKLTACGGIAFIKTGQPFLQAYALAESLCAHCKKQSTVSEGFKPSSLAFYRVTTSSIGKYDRILNDVETYSHDGTYYSKIMGAYDVCDSSASDLPRFSDLKKLNELLTDDQNNVFPSSYARRLLTEMSRSPHLVSEIYQRWRQMIKKGNELDLEEFDAIMKRLRVDKPEESPFTKEINNRSYTPLGDVISLNSIMQKG